MSYRYLRDWQVLPQSNKQQSVAKFMNEYEFVEVVYGTIQLMNNEYSKASVFDLEVDDSNLQGTFFNDVEGGEEKRANVRRQITEDLRSMADRSVPAHMQLYRVRFSDDYVTYGGGQDAEAGHAMSVVGTVMPRVPFKVMVVSSDAEQSGDGSYVVTLSSGRAGQIASLSIGEWDGGVRTDVVTVSTVDAQAGGAFVRLTLDGTTSTAQAAYAAGVMVPTVSAAMWNGMLKMDYSIRYSESADSGPAPYSGTESALSAYHVFELYDGSRWLSVQATGEAEEFVDGVKTGSVTMPFTVMATRVRMYVLYAGETFYSEEAPISF